MVTMAKVPPGRVWAEEGMSSEEVPVFAQTVGIAEILVGCLLLWTGRTARAGRLRRNRWAGYRTRSTMRSDAHWNAAHRAGAAHLLFAGLPPLLGGLFLLLAQPQRRFVDAIVLITAALMVLAVLIGARRAVRAATALPPGGNAHEPDQET